MRSSERLVLWGVAGLLCAAVAAAQQDANDLNTLQSRIQPVPLYEIERIIISGNKTTSSELVRAEVLLKVGERFDDELARLSRLRLLGLGFFSDVAMRLERGSRRGLVIWIIDVHERGNLLLNGLFAGLNQQGKPFGGMSWSHRNVNSAGQTVSLALTLGKAGGRGARFEWIDPYVTERHLRASAACWWSQTRDEFRDEFAGMSVRYSRIGGQIGLGFRNRGSTSAYLDVRAEQVNEQRRSLGDWQGRYLFPKQQSLVTSIAIAFDWDNRNDFFLPSEGQHLAVSLMCGGGLTGSDFDFLKFVARYEVSWPTRKAQYVRGTLDAGALAGTPPFFEKFYESQAVRGRQFAPFLGVTFEKENPKDALTSLNVEYHWLYFQKKTGFLYRAETYVFLDAGAVFDRDESGAFPIIYAVGPGLMFDTDIGSIKVALGFFL